MNIKGRESRKEFFLRLFFILLHRKQPRAQIPIRLGIMLHSHTSPPPSLGPQTRVILNYPGEKFPHVVPFLEMQLLLDMLLLLLDMLLLLS